MTPGDGAAGRDTASPAQAAPVAREVRTAPDSDSDSASDAAPNSNAALEGNAAPDIAAPDDNDSASDAAPASNAAPDDNDSASDAAPDENAARDDGRPPWVAPLFERAAHATWAELARFAPPADGSARASAVLVLLSETEQGPAVVLLERPSMMRRHAGQVAFPGGAVDPGDVDVVATALREADEEIGLDPRTVDELVSMPTLFLPPSNFLVTPVLAFWRRPHPLVRLAAAEVATVAVVPVAELVDPANRFTVVHPSGYRGPGFSAGGLFVWGFTAGVLDAVLRMGGWTRDWDVAVTRSVPALTDPVPGTVEG